MDVLVAETNLEFGWFGALIENCTTTWITTNGVNGRLVTGKDDYAGRSIFLPAAGSGKDSEHNFPGSCGCYWSSTPDSSLNRAAWYLDFDSESTEQSRSLRSDGRPVRPVRDAD